MKKIYLCLIVVLLLLSCRTTHVPEIPRDDFILSIAEMYEIDSITNHFPSSWLNERIRGEKWNALYLSCADDSMGSKFNSIAVFTDDASVSFIDSLEKKHFIYSAKFNEANVFKLNMWNIDERIPLPKTHIGTDTINAPIYDFRDASFLLGTEVDSIVVGGEKCWSEREILPEDMIVYVVDAKAGNFWKNKIKSELEPRPELPKKWLHGYSRGIAISHSCSRICWWIIVW